MPNIIHITQEISEKMDLILKNWNMDASDYYDALEKICTRIIEGQRDTQYVHDILINQVNLVKQYLEEMWEVQEPPSLLKIQYDLSSNQEFIEVLFDEVLAYLIAREEVFFDIDSDYILRIYGPESKEIRIKEIAFSLYYILEELWKKDKYPTSIEVKKIIAEQYNISQEDYLESLSLLKQFKLIEFVKRNKDLLRISKPLFYDNIIENMTLWNYEENEE